MRQPDAPENLGAGEVLLGVRVRRAPGGLRRAVAGGQFNSRQRSDRSRAAEPPRDAADWGTRPSARRGRRHRRHRRRPLSERTAAYLLTRNRHQRPRRPLVTSCPASAKRRLSARTPAQPTIRHRRLVASSPDRRTRPAGCRLHARKCPKPTGTLAHAGGRPRSQRPEHPDRRRVPVPDAEEFNPTDGRQRPGGARRPQARWCGKRAGDLHQGRTGGPAIVGAAPRRRPCAQPWRTSRRAPCTVPELESGASTTARPGEVPTPGGPPPRRTHHLVGSKPAGRPEAGADCAQLFLVRPSPNLRWATHHAEQARIFWRVAAPRQPRVSSIRRKPGQQDRGRCHSPRRQAGAGCVRRRTHGGTWRYRQSKMTLVEPAGAGMHWGVSRTRRSAPARMPHRLRWCVELRRRCAVRDAVRQRRENRSAEGTTC